MMGGINRVIRFRKTAKRQPKIIGFAFNVTKNRTNNAMVETVNKKKMLMFDVIYNKVRVRRIRPFTVKNSPAQPRIDPFLKRQLEKAKSERKNAFRQDWW